MTAIDQFFIVVHTHTHTHRTNLSRLNYNYRSLWWLTAHAVL